MKRTITQAVVIAVSLVVLLAAPTSVFAQVFHFGELNTQQFKELNRDRTAVIMSFLPVGVGAPEDFGPRTRDYGSLPLRPETKRAVLMDLVTGLGDAGFRWIFALDNHGPFVNKRMTDEASEYFEDTFGGTMVNLVGVVHPDPPAAVQP